MHSYNGHSSSDSAALEVGGCTVTPTRNLLERNGYPIKIAPRAMDALIYLAEHAGEVVSAEELLGVDPEYPCRLIFLQVYPERASIAE